MTWKTRLQRIGLALSMTSSVIRAILLPVKPGGCVHKHYNKVEGKPAKWMAFKYNTFSQVLGSMFEQVENSPDYQGEKKASSA